MLIHLSVCLNILLKLMLNRDNSLFLKEKRTFYKFKITPSLRPVFEVIVIVTDCVRTAELQHYRIFSAGVHCYSIFFKKQRGKLGRWLSG